MMEALTKRAEEIAGKAQQAKIAEVATKLKGLLGGAAIEIQEAAVVIRGRGIVRRWLIDPSLRFLAGSLK